MHRTRGVRFVRQTLVGIKSRFERYRTNPPKNLANTNEGLCQGDVLGFDVFLKEQAGAFAKFGGRFAGEVLAGFA